MKKAVLTLLFFGFFCTNINASNENDMAEAIKNGLLGAAEKIGQNMKDSFKPKTKFSLGDSLGRLGKTLEQQIERQIKTISFRSVWRGYKNAILGFIKLLIILKILDFVLFHIVKPLVLETFRFLFLKPIPKIVKETNLIWRGWARKSKPTKTQKLFYNQATHKALHEVIRVDKQIIKRNKKRKNPHSLPLPIAGRASRHWQDRSG